MKRRVIFSLTISVFLLGLASATTAEQTADPIEGVWVTSDGEGWVEIQQVGESLVGTIIGGPTDEDRRDDNNPDPALRNRRLTGLKIMDGFEADGPGKWTDGRIYDPDNGKTYRCNLQLENTDRLKVRGYLGVSLFGRTEIWTRKVDSQ